MSRPPNYCTGKCKIRKRDCCHLHHMCICRVEFNEMIVDGGFRTTYKAMHCLYQFMLTAALTVRYTTPQLSRSVIVWRIVIDGDWSQSSVYLQIMSFCSICDESTTYSYISILYDMFYGQRYHNRSKTECLNHHQTVIIGLQPYRHHHLFGLDWLSMRNKINMGYHRE